MKLLSSLVDMIVSYCIILIASVSRYVDHIYVKSQLIAFDRSLSGPESSPTQKEPK